MNKNKQFVTMKDLLNAFERYSKKKFVKYIKQSFVDKKEYCIVLLYRDKKPMYMTKIIGNTYDISINTSLIIPIIYKKCNSIKVFHTHPAFENDANFSKDDIQSMKYLTVILSLVGIKVIDFCLFYKNNKKIYIKSLYKFNELFFESLRKIAKSHELNKILILNPIL